MNNDPISFPEWKQVLARSRLSPSGQTAFAREIISLLRHCQQRRSDALTAPSPPKWQMNNGH
jgi:hypothetical protein